MSLKDKDIREPLFLFLEEMYGRTRFIEEKTMGHSRADVLMVTDDQLIGIEIKSDADTCQRLESQVKDYDSFCEELFERDYTTIEEDIRSYREGARRKKPYRKSRNGRIIHSPSAGTV